MKKLNITVGLMIGLTMMFTSCEKDLDNNPTLQSPSSFTLNTPSYSSSLIDMATSDSLAFTWSQPDYGFPVVAQYQIQVSSKNKWVVSADQAAEDATGKTLADYSTVSDPTGSCNVSVSAEAIDKALEQCERWTSDAVPSSQELYVRAFSVLNNDTVYSNVITMNVAPYYYELKDAAPEIWYLVGGCIGDGKWSNTSESIGVSLIPMFTSAGQEYDRKTGQGIIEYVGYFPADGAFKILKTIGDWDHYIWCGGADGTALSTSLRNGGDDTGNITIKDAGYYKITVNTNTKSLSCTVVKYDKTPTIYTSINLSGNYNGGTNSTAMTAVEKYATGVENHVWMMDNVVVSADGGITFNNGTTTWGGTSFPYGVAVTTTGASSIPAKAGTYKVFFNDITGAYYFYEK